MTFLTLISKLFVVFYRKGLALLLGGGMYNDGVQPEISARQRVPTRDSACIFANGVVLAVAL